MHDPEQEEPPKRRPRVDTDAFDLDEDCEQFLALARADSVSVFAALPTDTRVPIPPAWPEEETDQRSGPDLEPSGPDERRPTR